MLIPVQPAREEELVQRGGEGAHLDSLDHRQLVVALGLLYTDGVKGKAQGQG